MRQNTNDTRKTRIAGIVYQVYSVLQLLYAVHNCSTAVVARGICESLRLSAILSTCI